MSLPEVEYVSSFKQKVMDDWMGFVESDVLPVDVLCPTCNGIIKATNADHLASVKESKGWHNEFGMSDSDQETMIRAFLEVKGVREAAKKLFDDRASIQIHGSHAAYARLLEREEEEIQASVDDAVGRMRRELRTYDYTYTLSTICRHCNEWTPVTMPGSVPKDVAEVVEKRYADHRTVERWEWNKNISESPEFRERTRKIPKKSDPILFVTDPRDHVLSDETKARMAYRYNTTFLIVSITTFAVIGMAIGSVFL